MCPNAAMVYLLRPAQASGRSGTGNVSVTGMAIGIERLATAGKLCFTAAIDDIACSLAARARGNNDEQYEQI